MSDHCGNIKNDWKSLTDKQKYPLHDKMAPFCNKRRNCPQNCPDQVLSAENDGSRHGSKLYGGRRRRRRSKRRKSRRKRKTKRKRRKSRKRRKTRRRRRR